MSKNRNKNKSKANSRVTIIEGGSTADRNEIREIETDLSAESEVEGFLTAAAEPAGETDSGAVLPESTEETSDTIPAESGTKFIKADGAGLVTVGTEPIEDATTVERFTDRFTASVPAKKAHTGYTGKLNTYTAGHSAESSLPKFIPSEPTDSEEDLKELEKASASRPQTELEAEEIKAPDPDRADTKIILEKLPGTAPVTESESASPTKPFEAQGAGKGDLLRELATADETAPETESGQMMLEGFTEAESGKITESEKIKAETELENELNSTRVKKVSEFDVETGSDTPEEEPAPAHKSIKHGLRSYLAAKYSSSETRFASPDVGEYADPNDYKKLLGKLKDERKKTFIKALILSGIALVVFLADVICNIVVSANGGRFIVFGGSSGAYAVFNLVFLAAAAAVCFGELKKGLFAILKLTPDYGSFLFVSYVCALMQLLFTFGTKLTPESDFHILAGAPLLLSIPLMFARVCWLDSTRLSFRAVNSASGKSCLRDVRDPGLRASLTKSRDGLENVYFKGKTHFVTGFFDRAAGGAPRPNPIAAAVSAGIALVIWIAVFIACRVSLGHFSAAAAFGSAAAAFALSAPAGSLLYSALFIRSRNRALAVKGAYVSGYDSAKELEKVENIVLAGEDVVRAGIADIYCAPGVSRRQTLFVAGGLAKTAGGILAKAFEKETADITEKFPEVEQLEYNDKLGYSAWICGCRVLLGNGEFMDGHNITPPTDESVARVLGEGRMPMYLAIEGKFAALFAIEYSVTTEADIFRDMCFNGTNLLIRSNEPNLTEASYETLLGLPSDTVRLVSPASEEKIRVLENDVSDYEDAGIVFADSFTSFASAVRAALIMNRADKLGSVLSYSTAGAGLFFVAILSLIRCSLISLWGVMLFGVLLMAAAFVVPIIALPGEASNVGREFTKSISGIGSAVRETKIKRAQKTAEKEAAETEPEEIVSIEPIPPQPEDKSYLPDYGKFPVSDDFSLMNGAPSDPDGFGSENGNYPTVQDSADGYYEETDKSDSEETFAAKLNSVFGRLRGKRAKEENGASDEDFYDDIPAKREAMTGIDAQTEETPDFNYTREKISQAHFEPPQIETDISQFNDDLFSRFE